tara:strand:+ start:1328 stop:3043 length:1716 start_codon:yes stop_codon:yes gene_type:complete
MIKNNSDLKETLAFANKLLRNKNFDKAEKLYKKILKKFPDNYDANYFMASIKVQKNIYNEAKNYMEKTLFIKPNLPELNNNLGLIYLNLNEIEKSINYFQKAIDLNKNYSLAYANLGMAFVRLKKVPEAKENYLKALKIEPKNILANYNFANLLKRLGEIDNAEYYYKKTIELNPNYLPPYNNVMDLYDKSNQNEKLNDLINSAEKVFKNDQVIKSFKAKLFYKNRKYNEVINLLEKMEFLPEQVIQKQASYEVLAKSCDKVGDYGKAFKLFQMLNEIMDKSKDENVDKKIFLKITKDRLDFFDNIKIADWAPPKIPDDKKDPYFLVGFPRSGTTLLDTILRSHPSIEVLEEIPIINRFIDELYINKNFKLEKLENVDSDLIKEMRNYYFNQIEIYKKEKKKKIIIDKMPLNIVHVGEIFRFFPKAKFILALRHPYDCVLSCFMQNFMLNHAMANFLNLDDASKLYDITMSLWKKYNKVFKIDHHIIRYEDVISNFETTIRNLLGFLNLPWSKNVTEFYKTAEKRGIINTPSYNQVSQPIYSNSMYRWKNYEKEFINSKEYLDNWVKEFKY